MPSSSTPVPRPRRRPDASRSRPRGDADDGPPSSTVSALTPEPIGRQQKQQQQQQLSTVPGSGVNIAGEFPQLKLANVRNPHAIPYVAAAYDPLRRPFHRPTLHRQDGTYLSSTGPGSLASTHTAPPSSSSPYRSSTPAVHSGSHPPRRQIAGTPASRVRRRLELATGSSLASTASTVAIVETDSEVRRDDDATSRPESRALPCSDGGQLTVVSAASASPRRLHLVAAVPQTLYGDKHQAVCEYCQAAAYDASRKQIVSLMRDERGERHTAVADEATERDDIWRVFQPLHQRHLRTVARWLEHMRHSRDAARIRLALENAQREEAIERAALVRDALRTQRALLRCMVRTGAESIEHTEHSLRQELLAERVAAEGRAKQRAAEREEHIAGLHERGKLLQAGEERRRVALASEEFRAVTRLLLLERERRERVAYDVFRRREAEAAKQRQAVERDQDAGRQTVITAETDARAQLRSTINGTLNELRTALYTRRRQDLQRREDLGRRLKETALHHDMSTLLLSRVCPGMEVDARATIRDAERRDWARIAHSRADVLAKAERALGSDEELIAKTAHAAAAAEVVGDVLFAWTPKGRPTC